MNVPENLAKSSLLALVIFWTIISSVHFDQNVLLYVMLSFIPVCISVTIVILGTICPFYWSAKGNDVTNKQVFKLCFPYYTCIAFGLCSYGIVVSNYDLHFSAFCLSAFITTNQSWLWFAKEKTRIDDRI
ncbi:hypothetical protein [Psychroserpens damuponensis]|uniref:hypothetical protein n=1 Tax=Psychroserpens damuponensis TaxID=943936 RepID=UPI0012698A94|nr:hypothetical protein [Psychroserpens damuponensis]